jgi:glycosyltransferase involved in cell wall biosynthesis
MSLFTVIVATRNRPALFKEALDSVAAQTCADVDIVVVNDGSDDEHLPAYEAIIGQTTRPIRFFSLVQRPRGHGQSYALNFGVSQARSDYVCFLDDDDYWTDANYLQRARETIISSPTRPDLHMSNQAAYLNGERQPGPIWIESLTRYLQDSGRLPSAAGIYTASVADLMVLRGFCHLNTLVVRRALFEQIDGMDEGIRWECDRDFYLRLIDRAKLIHYSPNVVSRHNIPDPAKATSMTTSISVLERRLFQLRVFDKAALFAINHLIRAEGRRQKAYTLKHITEILVTQQDYATAAYYARLGLAAKPTVKWFAYTAWLMLRSKAPRAQRKTPALLADVGPVSEKFTGR